MHGKKIIPSEKILNRIETPEVCHRYTLRVGNEVWYTLRGLGGKVSAVNVVWGVLHALRDRRNGIGRCAFARSRRRTTSCCFDWDEANDPNDPGGADPDARGSADARGVGHDPDRYNRMEKRDMTLCDSSGLEYWLPKPFEYTGLQQQCTMDQVDESADTCTWITITPVTFPKSEHTGESSPVINWTT